MFCNCLYGECLNKLNHFLRRSAASRSKGFTLVELMVALAVAAILLGIAVPSFRDMLERNRVAAQSNDLLGGLQATRSEAIRKNATHRFCNSNAGWIVRTPISAVAIREGTLGGSTTATDICTDFRSDGLPYACDCANAAVGTALVTNGAITITSGAQTRTIRIRTGSIHVE
jgi:type IV fimbrial biogenesis protein FimT